jgi:hypothetical protein
MGSCDGLRQRRFAVLRHRCSASCYITMNIRCCLCNVNGSVVTLVSTALPGSGQRCRDQVNCRRRVRANIKSAELAEILDEGD